MYYVYILKLGNSDLYKGSTANLKERIKEHKHGRVISTKNKRPLFLIHLECYLLKSDALRREQFLKTNEGRRLLKQQIRDIIEDSSRRPMDRTSASGADDACSIHAGSTI